MDGNGRWAQRRGLPRLEGHRRGLVRVKEVIEAAAEEGVKNLTFYAFSSENWKRSKKEVRFLMSLCENFISSELAGMAKNDLCFKHLGRLAELPVALQRCIRRAEEETKGNGRLRVQMAFNYGARGEIIDAVKNIVRDVQSGALKDASITEDVFSRYLYTAGLPDPDLLIRTSGEMRVSNFLLWQICYAEFYVAEKCWPDFDRRELLCAIQDYQKRVRRFGGVDG